jgi:hypothetical protein
MWAIFESSIWLAFLFERRQAAASFRRVAASVVADGDG